MYVLRIHEQSKTFIIYMKIYIYKGCLVSTNQCMAPKLIIITKISLHRQVLASFHQQYRLQYFKRSDTYRDPLMRLLPII